MSTPPAVSSNFERLDRILKDLEIVCADVAVEDLHDAAVSKAVDDAKSAVTTLRNMLKRSQVEQLAELVRAKKWGQATERMQKNFLSCGIGLVEEVLALVYVGDDLDNLTSAIEWVDKLDARMLPRAYRTLYEQIQFKKHTEQPQMLLLWKKMGKLKDGVLEDVRTQLDGDCGRIIERLVQGIKQKDYCLLNNLKVVPNLFGSIFEDIILKFNIGTLEDTLLLIQFSQQLPEVVKSCVCIYMLFKSLPEHSMLDSEQALHLWAHLKFVVEEEARWKEMKKEFQNSAFQTLLNFMDEHKRTYFAHYQRYVEDPDRLKIDRMHKQNVHLQSVVSEFVSWYCNGDLDRVGRLLEVARAVSCREVSRRILTQLHSEMSAKDQMHTFEAVRLFNELQRCAALQQDAEAKASLEQLVKSAPSCLRLLLSGQELQLVNKFFNSPLCVQQEKVLCCSTLDNSEASFSTTLDEDSAQTTFSFKSDGNSWKLDASAEDGMAKVACFGSQWKLKPVDEHHVKIFNDQEIFLMADEPWLEDRNKRVVCLKRENSTDMQQWKIELAMKKIKIESAHW